MKKLCVNTQESREGVLRPSQEHDSLPNTFGNCLYRKCGGGSLRRAEQCRWRAWSICMNPTNMIDVANIGSFYSSPSAWQLQGSTHHDACFGSNQSHVSFEKSWMYSHTSCSWTTRNFKPAIPQNLVTQILLQNYSPYLSQLLKSSCTACKVP